MRIFVVMLKTIVFSIRHDKNIHPNDVISSKQGRLNQNEMQLNLCNMFSILIVKELYLFT